MRRSILAVIAAMFACAGLATSAVASAAPACPNNTVVVQGKVVSTPQSPVCDDDEETGGGLLGNAPIVGNLPGLGGIL